MAKGKQYTDEWFESKSYTKNPDGSYSPPKFVRDLKPSAELVVKQRVNNSPDFEIKSIVTEWFVPYQTPSKKNSRITFTNKKTGRVVNIPSQKYTEYKNVTKMYWETFGKEFKRTIESLNLQFPLNIEMTFTRKTNQLVDYFGPGESVFDLMTDFGWWEDDNRRFGKPFFGDMQVDKNNPGVKIKIILPKHGI